MAARHTGARVCLLVGLAVSGCAMIDQDNRRTLNLLDRHISPDSLGTQLALAPVVLPLGGVALAVDQFIVHPVCVGDDAWDDTRRILWESDDPSLFRRVLLVPLVALATPFFYLGDFLIRASTPFLESD